jgi:hypothetical protein
MIVHFSDPLVWNGEKAADAKKIRYRHARYPPWRSTLIFIATFCLGWMTAHLIWRLAWKCYRRWQR